MTNKAQEIYSKFGANERAIVDKIRNDFIRNIVIKIIGTKLKLQWTGWLQYLIPLPVILGLFVLGLIVYLFGGLYVAMIISAIGIILLTKVLFDIVTVKLKIRFHESRPKRNDDMNIFELMRSRYSCRSYQTQKLSKPDYKELMESVQKHLAEPRFSTEEIRFEYISTPIRVWPVVNATEFLVAIAPKEYNRLAVMDIGRTLQNIVIDATRMGLATCWIGPGADHKSITSKLGERFNPDKDNIICISAIGYKSLYIPLFIKIFSKQMRSRLPIESLFFDSYEMKQSIDINEEQYKSFGRIFEACQWAPSSYNGQTTRAIVVSNNNEISRIDFLASTSSRYYAAVASGIWCANWELGCNELHIDGEFTKLNDTEINLSDSQKIEGIPAYDMSWELKKPIKMN
jgi:nitroreductase